MAGAQGDRTQEGKLSLAAAVCKQIVELRRQDKHPNNGGRQNMETGDAAKSSNVGDLQDEGCVLGRGLRACKGVCKGGGWVTNLVLECPSLADSPPTSPKVANGIEVYSTKINSKVTSRFAHNVVTTRAVNRADTAKEVSFDVELPKTAFITNFTLWVPPWLLALGSGTGVWPSVIPHPQISFPAGPSTALPTLGMSRRRKLPRSSMKRLYPRARRLAWSSKHGLPGLGENVWDSRAFRATNSNNSYYYCYSKMCP